LRPTIGGIRGYAAALALAQQARVGSRSGATDVGSYGLSGPVQDGTSNRLAFFRTTYLNPMAMPSVTPGGDPALAHMGALLGDGGFEQVAPFRTLR
jgi:hypothetical protein